MNHLLLTVILVVSILFHSSYAEIPEVHEVGDDDEGTTEIIQGNCTTAFAVDMVFHEHVHKLLIPFVKRNATSSWHGNQTIYCVEVLNEDDDESTKGTAFVKDGGLKHNFITIEMHSKRSHGMEFDVQIYAR